MGCRTCDSVVIQSMSRFIFPSWSKYTLCVQTRGARRKPGVRMCRMRAVPITPHGPHHGSRDIGKTLFTRGQASVTRRWPQSSTVDPFQICPLQLLLTVGESKHDATAEQIPRQGNRAFPEAVDRQSYIQLSAASLPPGTAPRLVLREKLSAIMKSR